MLASGRLSLALGVALGLASLRALQKGWAVPASLAGLATALASPVAAVFLAGVLAAALIAEREHPARVPLIVAVATLAPILLPNIVFAAAGREPFAFSAWVALPLWCGGALFVTRGLSGERALRTVIGAYLLAGTLVWIVPNA